MNIVFDEFLDRPGEDAVAVLGHKDNVVVALVDNVREFSVFASGFRHSLQSTA